MGYLDKAIRPLVLIIPKMSEYIKTFKGKNGDKDKNNKLISFLIDDEKPLQKYKTIWTKTEDLKNIELNALPVYDDRYIKTKLRTHGNKVYTNFLGLMVPENDIESEIVINISDIAIITVKNIDYRCIIHNNGKSEAINLLESSVLEDCGYI